MAPRTTKYVARNLGAKDAAEQAVEVMPLGEGRYQVTVDGEAVEVESLVLPHGAVSMIVDGASYSVEFEEKGDAVSVLLNSQLSKFDLADERKLRLRSVSAQFDASGKQTVAAPMPGKVVKVLVKVGDAVEEGQGVVVVEAMKMENELKAPRAGTVLEVAVTEGATVDNGAKLVVIE